MDSDDLAAFLVAGPRGSGKSFLCTVLAHLLKGQCVSQDEAISSQGLSKELLFLQLVQSKAARPSIRHLFIDLASASHTAVAEAVFAGFKARKSGSVKLAAINLTDKEDLTGELCFSRIMKRSLRHIGIIPQAAHIRAVLETARAEPQLQDMEFDVTADLDMRMSPTSMAANALQQLLPVTGQTSLPAISSEKLCQAVAMAEACEQDFAKRWVTLYWVVELEPSVDLWGLEALADFLAQAKHAVQTQHPGVVQAVEPHVTLSWEECNPQLEKCEGEDMAMTVHSLCYDVLLGLIALKVSLDHASLCQNPHPHITVAKLPGVAAKQSNDLLLRESRGDTRITTLELPSPVEVKGTIQRRLDCESMAAATAALATTLPRGNPLCEFGLVATPFAFDVWAEVNSEITISACLADLGALVSQPLLHCKWPPPLRGKLWLTFHEKPLSARSISLLDTLESKGSVSAVHVAIAYFYSSENILQKTESKMQRDLEERLSGRVAAALLHARQAPLLQRRLGQTRSFCLRCFTAGAGADLPTLQKALAAVITASLGWVLDDQAELKLNAYFQDDWILLGFKALPAECSLQACQEHSPAGDGCASPELVSASNASVMQALGAALPPASESQGLVKIDGGFLQGGGQIVLCAATYAALLGAAVDIDHVRGCCSDAGLKQRHIAVLEGLRKLAGGSIHAEIEGTVVAFRPGTGTCDIDSNSFVVDTGTSALTEAVQALLPIMLARSHAIGGSEVEVIFKGGTNVCQLNHAGLFEVAPQVEFLQMVVFPMLRRLFGVSLGLQVRRRGFSQGGGEVAVRASTCQWPLHCCELLSQGTVASISGAAYSSAGIPKNVLGRMMKGQLRKREAGAELFLNERYPATPCHFNCKGGIPSAHGADACGLVVAITTTTGCCFGGGSMGRPGVAAEVIGEEAARAAVRSLQGGGAADERLEEQLVVFMAIAKGTSRLRLGKAAQSLPLQSALWLAECFGATVRVVQQGENHTLEMDGIGDRSPPYLPASA
ncbi:unnamed protein product [Effrenium voratum]|uniref:RNA 3'-terminal-phosphate cyclase (ATP) n=1 Tax=Effrenium voratum TaxID=2562239 RepID=A0AA36I0C1_9DINO|nr:unnamed protein product [Effrenium voratum]CAJ1415805.1 unnamed protein product [Effrenium voratum]